MLELPSGANPAIIILLHFFSLFLEEMDAIFTRDTCFSFLWFLLLYSTTVPSSVKSLFSLKLSDLQEALLNILCRMLNRPLLFCWLYYYFLLLGTKIQDSSVEVYCNRLWMSPVSLIWSQSVINLRLLKRRPLLSWGCHSARSDTLSGCLPFTTNNN